MQNAGAALRRGKTDHPMSAELVKLLAARGTSPRQICEQARVTWVHGSEIFRGKRTGIPTRRRLAPHLMPAELELLGWVGNSRLATVQDLVFHGEDAAVRQVESMLAAYQKNRQAVVRICGIMADHPELFGATGEKESYLDLAARKLEEFVETWGKEKAA